MSPEDAPVNSNRNRDGASRTSGTRPSARSADTTAFRKPTFRSFSKRPNFASTTEHPASNCELSNAGQTQALANRSGTAPKKTPPLPGPAVDHQIGLILPSSIGNASSGWTHPVRRMEMCKHRFCFSATDMPRSFSERGFCRVGELMGVFGAEWGILGKVGRPVAWAQARVSCSWRLRRTEDCRRCREAPIAEPARAMPALHRGVRALEPQRVLDDGGFRSFFGLRGAAAPAAPSHALDQAAFSRRMRAANSSC
jgi:hypothetical protein